MNLEKEIAETKVKCNRRVRRFAGLLCICGGLISTQIINRLMPFARVTDHYAAILKGFQYGVIAGLMGVALFFIIYYGRGAGSDECARKIYIRENDERNKLIKEKAGIRFYFINVFFLAVASVIAGYFDHIVFFTLVGTIYLQIFIMLGSKIYWKIKL